MNTHSLLTFLKQLKKNNNKDWFEKNREQYEIIKEDFKVTVDRLIQQIAVFDPSIGMLSAKDCMFRINRDVRFSKDKSPYKTNIGAYFAEGGKKSVKAGYYLHIEPNNKSMIAGGMYMPPNDVLSKIREEIDYNSADFKKIITQSDFKKYFKKVTGDQLINPPKGYDKDNPMIEWLKFKSYIVTHPLSDADLNSKNLEKYIVKVFKVIYPFIQFFNRSLDE